MTPRTWLEKAEHYLAAAQLLLEVAEYDSAVSRAYYAARYAAIHLFLTRNIRWTDKWQHDSIADKIKEQARLLPWLRIVAMPHLATFSESWAELLEKRSDADYKLGKINERIAQSSLAFAQAVIQAIKENVP